MNSQKEDMNHITQYLRKTVGREAWHLVPWYKTITVLQSFGQRNSFHFWNLFHKCHLPRLLDHSTTLPLHKSERMRLFLFALLLAVALHGFADARYVPPARRRGRRMQETDGDSTAAGASPVGRSASPPASMSGAATPRATSKPDKKKKKKKQLSAIEIWKANQARQKKKEGGNSKAKAAKSRLKTVEVGAKGDTKSASTSPAKKKKKDPSAINTWKAHQARKANTRKLNRGKGVKVPAAKPATKGHPHAGLPHAPPPKVYVDKNTPADPTKGVPAVRDEDTKKGKRSKKKPSALDLWKKQRNKQAAAAKAKKW